jgi:hypothetical protein
VSELWHFYDSEGARRAREERRTGQAAELRAKQVLDWAATFLARWFYPTPKRSDPRESLLVGNTF